MNVFRRMSDWLSVACWSNYHRDCRSEKCTCSCHGGAQ